MIGLIGKKIGMTRIMDDEGICIPVTLIECLPNKIVQLKTEEKDGYSAIVVGAFPLNKPTKNKQYRVLKEFHVDSIENYKIGDAVDVSIFADLKKIQLKARSKGRGFAGVIKRHNFGRGPETHGSHHHRAPGSIGACAMPGRVAKGKKMPGRMGNAQKTLKNVPVVEVSLEKNYVAIKGPVAGPINGIIQLITSS